MAGCLENNGALMSRAESLLTHMSRKYVGRVHVRAASLSLSLSFSPLLSLYPLILPRLHIHTHDTSDLF